MTDDQSLAWGWLYYALTLCSGTVSSIITKRISKETAPLPGTYPPIMDYFQHPYMMTLFMFIGELLCLPILYISRLFTSQKSKSNRINPLLCAIPALCDAVGSALAYNAYNYMAVSIIQMLSGIRIIVTAIFSRIFLKTPLHLHHIIGMIIIFLGMAIVGTSAYMDTSGESQPIGFLFLALSYLLSPIQLIVEEALLSSYTANPLEIIGYEGIFGFAFMSLLLVVFQHIPCTRIGKSGSNDLYPQTAYCPYGKIEDSYIGFFQLKHSPTIMEFVMLMIVALCVLNFSSVGVIKHLKSRVRSTMSVTQTIIIWIINITFQWEQFNCLQFIGFILSTLGIIIYNEIYFPPIKVFKYDIKKD